MFEIILQCSVMVRLPKSCALTWWPGLRAMVILKAIPFGTLVLGGFNCAEQFWARIQTNRSTSSSRLGVGEGLLSHPRKQVSLFMLLKTRALFKMAGEGYRALFIIEREKARVGM